MSVYAIATHSLAFVFPDNVSDVQNSVSAQNFFWSLLIRTYSFPSAGHFSYRTSLSDIFEVADFFTSQTYSADVFVGRTRAAPRVIALGVRGPAVSSGRKRTRAVVGRVEIRPSARGPARPAAAAATVARSTTGRDRKRSEAIHSMLIARRSPKKNGITYSWFGVLSGRNKRKTSVTAETTSGQYTRDNEERVRENIVVS